MYLRENIIFGGDGQNTDPQSMDYPNGLPKWTTLTWTTPKNTVLCKSNANEFQRNSWLFEEISTIFPRIFVTPIVLIRAIFRMIIRIAR